MYTLTETQLNNAKAAANKALEFCVNSSADLPAAQIRYLWFEGAADEVVASLASYQNDDGGFGNRLEPDIHASASNPFAARIAMQYLQSLPTGSADDMQNRLRTWLDTNQHDDGDWHLSDATKSDFLQPWFAAWQHPALNPACCVTGLAASLGIATDKMRRQTATLFAEKATIEEVETGEFYNLLPYVEYMAGVTLPDSEQWLDAIAKRLVGMAESGEFEDAEHFFTLAAGGSQENTNRIPDELISQQIDALLTDQQDDGGWPTPYDAAWRVWSTSAAMVTLAQFRATRH